MAQIDFSNAVLVESNNNFRFIDNAYLGFNTSSSSVTINLYDETGNTAFTISDRKFLTQTPTKVEFELVGSVPASMSPSSGNVIQVRSGTAVRYNITNVSYNAGDVFDFVIELSLSVT